MLTKKPLPVLVTNTVTAITITSDLTVVTNIKLVATTSTPATIPVTIKAR